jgi:hypothetical protein
MTLDERIDDLALAWATADPASLRAVLRLVGFDERPDGSLAVDGLRVTIDAASGRDRLAWAEPPGAGSVVGFAADGAVDPAIDQVTGFGGARVPRLVAVAVSTVDLERGAVPFSGVRGALPADALLGARAAWSGTPGVVLAEPTTEGRLAASLARWGEGPAAIYVAVGRPVLETVAVALERLGERPRHGTGPFGAQLLAQTSSAWGPHLLLVGEPRTGGPAREPAAAGNLPSGGDEMLHDERTRADASATIRT